MNVKFTLNLTDNFRDAIAA